jgi:hypothetical protein
MDLDDLKNTWEDIKNQAEKQQNLSPEIIDQMTQKKYYSKLRRIAYSEIIGISICLMGAFYIGLNFYKLDTAFLQGVGVVSIFLLLTLSIISILSLRQFNIPSDVNKPYAETLKRFAVQKIQFHKFQKINIILSYLLLVTIIILLSKFFSGKDITDSKYFWTFSFSFGYLFLLFYSRWVLKYYNKTLRQAEELLQELQP